MRNRIPIAMLSVLAALPALAATDGTLGSTSTGTLNITATVPQPDNPTGARITGLTDIDFGTYTGNEVQQVMEFCLYHSSPNARLFVSGVGDPNTFLRGTDGQVITVSYQFFSTWSGNWSSVLTGAGNTMTAWNRTSQTCSTGEKAQIRWILPAEQNVAPGAYTGQIQLVIQTQ